MRLQFSSLLLFCFTLTALTAVTDVRAQEEESPWLLTPSFSSDPKLGNSLGALAAYLHKYDEESPTSMFGVMGSRSDTESTIYGLFGKTYFSADQHRITYGFMKGKIENEYEDFLGSGFDAITTDDLAMNFIRYTKRLRNDWFVGAQIAGMDYDIVAGDQQTQDILDLVGLDGMVSNGIGAVVERDTRDNQNSPKNGSLLNINNFAFRESFGGDDSFDSFTGKYSKFISHGEDNVIAFQIDGRWTDDAPTSGYSSVNLRGYTRGEYLAPHSITAQIEERYSFNSKWGATGFVGVSCLYGNDAGCGESENWFPAAGAGITYVLKVDAQMVVRAEVAVGKNGNNGFYIGFGNSF